MTADDARRLALALAETTEEDHHGRPSFRVQGHIFATLWDPEHMNVMLDYEGIRAAVAESPEWCSELWWGKRLAAVRVRLAKAEPRLLAELLDEAWRRKAPRRLLTP